MPSSTAFGDYSSPRPSAYVEPNRDHCARLLVFGSVAVFDLLLWIDAALRWEKGFGFWRSEWLRDAGVVFAVQLFVAWLLVRRPSPAWLAASWALPSLCVGFMAASAGTSVFDWRSTPVFSFVTDSWIDKLVEQGGLYTALAGTLAYALWYGAGRQVLRLEPRKALERRLFLLGMGWMVASTIRLSGFVEIHADPRARSPQDLYLVELARSALWGSTFAIGLVAFATGFYRRQVRYYRISRDPDR